MGNHTSTPMISCHLGECDNSKNKTKNLLRPGDTIRGTIKLTVPGVNGNNDDYLKVLRESFDGISIDVAGVEYVVMPPTSSEEEEKEEQHQQQQSRRWLKPTHNVIRLKASVADFNDRNKNDDSSCGQYYYPFEIELPTNASYEKHERIAIEKALSSSSSPSSSPLTLSSKKTPILLPSYSSTSSVSSSSSVPSGILLRHNSSNEEDDDSDNQSLSDDEFSDGGCNDSTNGNKNNNDDSNLSLSFRRKTVIAYRLKAFLRRKPGVRLTTDTDVKCYAE